MSDTLPRRSASALRRVPAAAVFLAIVAAAAAAPGTRPAAAAPRESPDPCNITGVERVVAVADVHGAYDQFVAILQAVGIVDENGRWSGGRAHFVQMGDVVDRGPAARKALDLIWRLEREAARAGGRVHALLGNHEVLAMLGDVRYTSADEFREFRTRDAEAVRELYYQRMLADRQDKAKASGQPFDEAAFRSQFLKVTPLGFVERQVAFGPYGEYGEWLREHDTVVRINQVVFVHGGLSPATAGLGCAAINTRVRAELTTDFDKMLADQEASLIAGEDGPLWYRGLAELGEAPSNPQVDTVLSRLKATAIVIGHSVVEEGRIRVAAGGRVFQIDTGMLTSAFGGRPSALEIKDGVFTAIYLDGRERLAPSLPAR
jgi:hypothetical protein